MNSVGASGSTQSAGMAELKNTIEGKTIGISKDLKSPFVQLKAIFSKILSLIGINVGAKIDSIAIRNKLAIVQEPLVKAFDIGLEAQRHGAHRDIDTCNIDAVAGFLKQTVEVDGTQMNFAEVILRTGDSELQGKVIEFIKNCPFNERRAICVGIDIAQLRRNVPSQHEHALQELRSAAATSKYETVQSWDQNQEHCRVIAGDPTIISTEAGRISGRVGISGVKSQLENVRNQHEAVAALQLLRTPQMLKELNQLGALNNNAAVSELILAASGPASEILQNYGTDRSNFVLNMDATVSAIASQRTETTSTNHTGKRDGTRLENMPRDVFVQLMAKAEEWYFGDQQGEFPQELAGIRKGVEAWFEKFAETNFSATGNKLATEYKQHFRAIANGDPAMLTKIKKRAMESTVIGVEDAYLTLIEHQSRETRKEFTNLSLSVYQRFQSNGSDGGSVADMYRSLERQPFGPNTDIHTVQTSRLDTLWCQYPTEESLTYLFIPRTGETPKQTAERVIGFLKEHPRDDSRSTNFLELLAYSPSAERISLIETYEFTDATCQANSQRFWDGLNAVLNNAEISSDERQALWQHGATPVLTSLAI